jgi:hypothetical protein
MAEAGIKAWRFPGIGRISSIRERAARYVSNDQVQRARYGSTLQWNIAAALSQEAAPLLSTP